MWEFFKSILWVSLFGASIYYFSEPIWRVLNILPDVMEKTSKIDLGPISLDIKENQLPKPTEQVGSAIRKMDRSAIETIMRSGSNTRHCTNSNFSDRHEFNDLESIGLATTGVDEQSQDDSCKYYFELTSLGEEVREYLIQLMAAQAAAT